MIKTTGQAFILFLVLTGCFSKGDDPSGFRIFTDDLNRQVKIRHVPERIVSMAPSITEMLYFIGVGDKIVGVTDYCDYPPEARTKEKVGGFINPNLEVIAGLSPDLVIATVDGNRKETVNKLAELGIPVFALNSRTVEDIFAGLKKLGQLMSIDSITVDLIAKMNHKIRQISEKTDMLSRPKVLLLYSIEPLITVNRNTFAHDLIELAGGINIAADAMTNYPQYNMESVLKKDPDIIIFVTMNEEFAGKLEEKWKEWKSISAVKRNRLFTLTATTGAAELARPGPRVVAALEKLVDLFHHTD